MTSSSSTAILLGFLNVLLFLFVPTIADGPTGGSQDNPGTRFCLRPKGYNAVQTSFGKVFDAEIPKITLANANIPLGLIEDGLFSVQQVKTVKYTPAKSHTLTPSAPNFLRWTARSFSFVSQGSFTTSFLKLGSGFFTAQSPDASVEVQVTVTPNTAQNDQRPYLKVANCTATAPSASLDVNMEGLLAALLVLYKNSIEKQKVTVVQGLICQTVTYYVESVLNEMIRTSQFNASVIDTNMDYPHFPSNLIYNYGLMKPATMVGDCFAMDVSGETSWNNMGGTGFNPANLDTSLKSTDNMLDVYVSDYSFNSLFYHAQAHKVFDTIFGDSKTLAFKPILQTSCVGKSQCIGAIFTELSKKYLSQSVEVEQLLQSTPPYILFTPDGENLFFVESTLNFVARSKSTAKKETFLTTQSQMEGVLTFNFNKNNQIIPNLTIKKIVLRRVQSSLNVNGTDQNAMNSLTDLLKPTFEKQINQKFAKGYALSGNKIVDLVQPTTLRYSNRTMFISTAFKFDDIYLLKLAAQARINVQGKS